MIQPLISIIIPAYNAAAFLGATLESIRAQSYQNFEVFIVIDKKSDIPTEELALEWAKKDPRFKAIIRETSGTAENRNFALKRSTGEYIAFVDADDLWSPEKLEKQIGFMLKNKVRFSFHAYHRIDEAGQAVGRYIPVPEKVSYNSTLLNNQIGLLTVMIEKSLIIPHEFEDKGWEDFGMWLKILKNEPYAYGINEPLGLYRIVHNARSNNKIFAAKMRWMALRQQANLPAVVCVVTMMAYAVMGYLKYDLKKNFRASHK